MYCNTAQAFLAAPWHTPIKTSRSTKAPHS